MSDDRWLWQCECVIPSRAGAGRRLQEEIVQQLQQRDWIQHDIFSIRLALEEALINAIKHGNHFDMTKQVRVACRLASDLLRIEIVDEGPGFNPEEIPDPTSSGRLESPCGRGVMLMRRFMSRVEYSPRGNHVVLEKERAQSA